MIPNMYKIAGELTPTVFHIAARSLAAQGLSIFGDHARRDGGAADGLGDALLGVGAGSGGLRASSRTRPRWKRACRSCISSMASARRMKSARLRTFRTRCLRAMINEERVLECRARAMTPDRPVLRGTAQNPDVYFQAREAANKFYLPVPGDVQKAMDKFAELTGRKYQLYEYHGAPDAERVIVIMGSGCEAAHETVDFLDGQGREGRRVEGAAVPPVRERCASSRHCPRP